MLLCQEKLVFCRILLEIKRSIGVYPNLFIIRKVMTIPGNRYSGQLIEKVDISPKSATLPLSGGGAAARVGGAGAHRDGGGRLRGGGGGPLAGGGGGAPAEMGRGGAAGGGAR